MLLTGEAVYWGLKLMERTPAQVYFGYIAVLIAGNIILPWMTYDVHED